MRNSSSSALAGKIVWLTGASSGIGEALSHELALRGAKVAMTARRGEVLQEHARVIASRGFSAFCFPGDVTKNEEVAKIACQIQEELGPIDIVIANAGNHLFTIPEKFDSAEYLQLMDLNFGGALRCIEQVLAQMINRRSGHIVGMSSLAGYRGLPRAAAYGASKAALINFLESIRFHLTKYSIDVTIVNPGFVKTPLTDKNDFYMPFLMDAPRAASIICNGIEKRKKEISFPRPFNWIVGLGRILPYFLYERIVSRIW